MTSTIYAILIAKHTRYFLLYVISCSSDVISELSYKLLKAIVLRLSAPPKCQHLIEKGEESIHQKPKP
ncbi:MAG: hypothetical protein WCF23_11490 [Candidatus Nitrosopolaris sp.]